jgi:hypothetical protein
MAIDGQYPPYFAIYTKGTEHGWYGKKVVYQNQDADLNLFAGQKCLMYFAATAQDYPRNPDQLREINCPILAAQSDTPAPNDEILFITLQSDSSWAPGSFAGVVSQVGFKFVENIVDYELKANLASGTGSDVNITNSYLNTHATVYIGGTPVSAGTNAFPVILDGASTVQIEATNGDALTATAGALNIANANIDKLSFEDKTSNLNVCVVSGIPIQSYNDVPAVASRIVDSQNAAFTNTVSGALDVCVRNTAAIDVAISDPVAITNAALSSMTFSTESSLQVQLANATGYIGAGNPLIVQTVPPTLTAFTWTLADFSDGGNPGSVSPTIPSGLIDTITVFGTDTNSTGMSSPYLVYQYCITDSATPSDWVDTLPFINLPNGGSFYDVRAPVVPYLRLKIQGYISPPGPVVDTLTLNVCYK